MAVRLGESKQDLKLTLKFHVLRSLMTDAEDTRTAMLMVYFLGKFASRGGFVVLLQYTSEIFPTGLRCATNTIDLDRTY